MVSWAYSNLVWCKLGNIKLIYWNRRCVCLLTHTVEKNQCAKYVKKGPIREEISMEKNVVREYATQSPLHHVLKKKPWILGHFFYLHNIVSMAIWIGYVVKKIRMFHIKMIPFCNIVASSYDWITKNKSNHCHCCCCYRCSEDLLTSDSLQDLSI